MDIRIIGSTQPGNELPVEEAKLFSGHSAGICYMKDDFDKILAEPEEKTLTRFNGTAGSGHHSVSGHVSYNLLISGIPKIIAMILNNEKDYNTSEKSARYTKMETSGAEKELYEKWIEKFEKLIHERYSQLDDTVTRKLAQENARYFISVFTPSTTMEYTVDFRQGNYLIGFLESPNLAERMPEDFYQKLKPWLDETAKALRSVLNCEEIRDNKGRELSLFATRKRSEYFGEVYSTNYYGSFAQVAQAHRHRSLNYEITIPTNKKFFVPALIRKGDEVKKEYLDDMALVAENYPQGMMVMINERGIPENFILKCHERLCGAAQWEICMQTRRTLEKYWKEASNYIIASTMLEHYEKTKCQFGYCTCNRPCPLGQSQAFTREV
ncbi:FAD-dependent thymidylate synthase [Candidatus Saccharibacteria bacterium]|nr:FAD-dependent thymidylate synthase [Candidatus Saccharibacteria bacterium]